MRTSGEIDAYPENMGDWEAENSGDLASEEINALFGWGSFFHEIFELYIDGVDETTAKLPADWKSRSVSVEFEAEGRRVKAIAPAPEDKTASLATLFFAFPKFSHGQTYPGRWTGCRGKSAIMGRKIGFPGRRWTNQGRLNRGVEPAC